MRDDIFSSESKTPIQRIGIVLGIAVAIAIDLITGFCFGRVIGIIPSNPDKIQIFLGAFCFAGIVDVICLILLALGLYVYNYIAYGTNDEDKIQEIKDARIHEMNRVKEVANQIIHDKDLEAANLEIEAMLRKSEYDRLNQ